jgi:CRP-like cAMP-binding protein
MALTKLEQIWLRDVLGRTGFFKFLSPPEIELLYDRMAVLSYEKGEKIIKEGAAGGAFYILSHGRVGIIKESEGSLSLGEIDGGNFFGEISLLTAAPRTTSVVALEDVKLFTIGKKDFADIFLRNGQIKKILEKHGKARSDDTQKKIRRKNPAQGKPGIPLAERIIGTFRQLVAPATTTASSSYKTRMLDKYEEREYPFKTRLFEEVEAEQQVQHISELLKKRKDNWLVNKDE